MQFLLLIAMLLCTSVNFSEGGRVVLGIGCFIMPHEKGLIICTGGKQYWRNQTVPNTTKWNIYNDGDKIFVVPYGGHTIAPIQPIQPIDNHIDLSEQTIDSFSMKLNNYKGPNVIVSESGHIEDSLDSVASGTYTIPVKRKQNRGTTLGQGEQVNQSQIVQQPQTNELAQIRQIRAREYQRQRDEEQRRQRDEEQRQRDEEQRQWDEEQRQWEEEQRQWEEEQRQWEEEQRQREMEQRQMHEIHGRAGVHVQEQQTHTNNQQSDSILEAFRAALNSRGGVTIASGGNGSYRKSHEKGHIIHTAGKYYSRNQTVPNTTKYDIYNRENEIFAVPISGLTLADSQGQANQPIEATNGYIDLTQQSLKSFTMNLKEYTGPDIMISDAVGFTKEKLGNDIHIHHPTN